MRRTKTPKMKFQINNTFTDALPSDPIVENTRRQVRQACYSFGNQE
ncbi:hypothetical protein [Aureivirga sp. CE67]|nr:hypothetical protein [Aureivirga sp. CE67]